MTATLDQAAADPQRTIAELQRQLDECRAELTARNSEFDERIEHQSATIDVLKAMSASPGDPQPVFNLIARRARDLCNTTNAGLFEFDGELVHLRSWVGIEAYGTPEAVEAYTRLFPMVPTRGSITCRAILDRQIIHVRDMATAPGVSAAVRNLGHKSQISLPLLRDGAALGAMALSSPEIGGFTDSQVALLQTFAEQAVIAITSAETYRELQQRTADLQESLEYQTATSDVLKVISRSTSDVQPVMDTVVETAARLCGADAATINIREGEVYRPVSSSTSAAEPEHWAIRRLRTIVPGRDTIPGRVALEGRVVHVADIRAEPDYADAQPETVAAGRRTILGVPLLREGAVLGTIGLARTRVEPFSERQIELVRTFADQAVIAIENARLLSELQARTHDLEESLEYQTATSDVLKVISRSTFDIKPVFETIVETAARLCNADGGTITTREGEAYRVAATFAQTPEYDVFIRGGLFTADRKSVTGRTALEGQVIHVADVASDPEYNLPEAVTLGKYRTCLGVPLLREGVVVGVIAIGRQRVQPYTDRQIELVRTFADQAVIALENARLLTELQQRTDELAARNNEYGERIEHQSATIDVLKAMSASPGDPQPVFDLIVRRARDLCNAPRAGLFEFDGELVHRRSGGAPRYTARPRHLMPTSGCFRWCRRAVPSLAGRSSTGRPFMCATWRPYPESARPFAISVTSRR